MDDFFGEIVEEKCDRCGIDFKVKQWRIVDSLEHPDLIEQIENNTIHNIDCPHCQYSQQTRSFAIFSNHKPSEIGFHFSSKIVEEQRLQIVSHFYFILGKAFAKEGLYKAAIQSFEVCREIQEQTKNIPNLAATLFELARLYHRTGRLEQARLYFKDTLRLFRRINAEEKIAAVLTALGNLEMQTGKLSQASKHLQEAREYYQREDRPERLQEVDKLLKLLPNNTAQKV